MSLAEPVVETKQKQTHVNSTNFAIKPSPEKSPDTMAVYRQWLGHPVERVNQHKQILNGWHFFSAEPEYIRQAAVRERDGLVLTKTPSDAWRQLMKVHTAHKLAQVVRFLSGKVTLARPSGPPGSDSVVQPPSITRMPDGTLHLRVWLASPPNFQPWMKEIIVPQTQASK